MCSWKDSMYNVDGALSDVEPWNMYLDKHFSMLFRSSKDLSLEKKGRNTMNKIGRGQVITASGLVRLKSPRQYLLI